MILEASKDQSRKDLENFLRERKRASEYENAAAAKILKPEEEVASLQDALTDQAQDAETQAEMARFIKARGGCKLKSFRYIPMKRTKTTLIFLKVSNLLSKTKALFMGQRKRPKMRRPWEGLRKTMTILP